MQRSRTVAAFTIDGLGMDAKLLQSFRDNFRSTNVAMHALASDRAFEPGIALGVTWRQIPSRSGRVPRGRGLHQEPVDVDQVAARVTTGANRPGCRIVSQEPFAAVAPQQEFAMSHSTIGLCDLVTSRRAIVRELPPLGFLGRGGRSERVAMTRCRVAGGLGGMALRAFFRSRKVHAGAGIGKSAWQRRGQSCGRIARRGVRR